EMGKAMMGTGEASGEDRAIQAAEKAIANPLLDEISLRGAKGVLINITGGSDLTLFELDEAANRIREEVDPDANIIVGSTLDDRMDGVMRVSVVATGIDVAVSEAEAPAPRRTLAQPLAQPAPAPAPVEAPRAAAPAPQPEPQPVRAEPAPQAVAAQDRTLFDAPVEDEDGLPPPAYQPQPTAAQMAQSRSVHVEDEAGAFVAPRPRAPGTPTPEALARLQAAVNRQPGQAARQAQPAAPARQPQPAERARFGINTLINRMTGHSHEGAERAAPAVRQQPRMHTSYEEETEVDPDQERIEIPAFLRRQAN
ncbi:MAG: cell division protein FtsZ, partial [Rhodobacteraceae bacterium]|nr:cell division protein FtsZ [Paracoccaceae bacterium]